MGKTVAVTTVGKGLRHPAHVRLRALVDARGEPLRVVASNLGTSIETARRLLWGVRGPSLKMAIAIERAYGIPSAEWAK